MKKISRKIGLTIMVCCLVIIFIFGGMSIFRGVTIVRNAAEEKLLWMSKKYAATFSQELLVIEDKLDEIEVFMRETIDIEALKNDSTYLARYEEELAPFVKDFAEKRTKSIAAWVYFDPSLSDTPHDVYYVDGDGDGAADRQNYIPFSYYDQIPLPDDDKYWWYGPIEKDGTFWTNPYEWTLANNEVIKVVSCAKPLYIEDVFVGVYGTYYRFDKIIKDIESITVYESGFASLYNEKFDVVIHPIFKAGNRNTSDNLETVDEGVFKDIVEQIKHSDSGVFPYNDRGESGLFAYSKLANGWVFALTPPESQVYSEMVVLIYQIAALVVFVILLSLLVAFIMGRSIAKPILTVVEATQKIGVGDFSAKIDVDTKDEIKTVADSINLMVGNIKSLQDELTKIAYFDKVTGTFNRAGFEERALELIDKYSTNYAYIILDVSMFTFINESFGHEQGDLLLKHIATVLKEEVTKDEVFARYGGDKFHLLFTFINKYTLEKRLEYIAFKIAKFRFEAKPSYKTVVNFGVYALENKTLNILEIGDKAKIALTKNRGSLSKKHVFFFNEKIKNEISWEQEIENNMEFALKDGQFKLYLLPKHSIWDGSVLGTEALVRWQSPKKGVLNPSEFIHIFERNGFIADLDMYIFECVCKKLSDMLKFNQNPMPIAINQSAQYIFSTEYITKMLSVLAKYNVPSHLIELEIKERSFADHKGEMMRLTSQLRMLGFKVTIDNFGEGFSTLNILSDLSVDTIKLDKSFFSKESFDEKGKKVLNTVIDLAHSLGIEPTAKGVETPEHFEFLKQTKCTKAQGYYFSTPIHIDIFEKGTKL